MPAAQLSGCWDIYVRQVWMTRRVGAHQQLVLMFAALIAIASCAGVLQHVVKPAAAASLVAEQSILGWLVFRQQLVCRQQFAAACVYRRCEC
jgi:hypothetical protein